MSANFLRPYESAMDAVRTVSALLDAVIELGGFDQQPPDPGEHRAHDQCHRLLGLAAGVVADCVKEDAAFAVQRAEEAQS